ncbi:MAG: putative membrane protein YfcA [Myxococcota bacterium]|jgi:uncharacterized membrane protein YfcA
MLVAGVAFVAGAIQGALGFGFGLTAMALLCIWWPVREAVPVVALLALALNIGLLWRYRDHVQARSAAPLAVGGLLGVPVGLAFLVGAPPKGLELGLGMALLSYVALRLVQPPSAPPSWSAPLAGVIGGVLHGAFNTGGPPAVLYASARIDWSPIAMKSVLTVYFTTLGVCGVCLLVATGLLGQEQIALASVGVPAAVLGGWTGHWAGGSLPERLFRQLVVGGIGTLGLVFTARALGS